MSQMTIIVARPIWDGDPEQCPRCGKCYEWQIVTTDLECECGFARHLAHEELARVAKLAQDFIRVLTPVQTVPVEVPF